MDAGALISVDMSWLLHEAAAKGDIGEVELLAHPGTVNLLDGKGQTPLHRAAKSGSILVTRHLLKKGAISDTVDKVV